MVTEAVTYGGTEKVWKTVQMNFSCLCYLKIRRRPHIIRAVGFPCTTECLEGLMSSQDQFRPGLEWAEVQRLNWGFLLTPQLLCKTWEQNFPGFPIHEEQSLYFSAWIIIFFFRLRKTERREKENGWVMAVSLLKHSCACPSNGILRACIQNLLQDKSGTFKNNHADRKSVV